MSDQHIPGGGDGSPTAMERFNAMRSAKTDDGLSDMTVLVNLLEAPLGLSQRPAIFMADRILAAGFSRVGAGSTGGAPTREGQINRVQRAWAKLMRNEMRFGGYIRPQDYQTREFATMLYDALVSEDAVAASRVPSESPAALEEGQNKVTSIRDALTKLALDYGEDRGHEGALYIEQWRDREYPALPLSSESPDTEQKA